MSSGFDDDDDARAHGRLTEEFNFHRHRAQAVKPHVRRKQRAARANTVDRELGAKREQCVTTVRESWGGCDDPDDPMVFENCVMRCSSASCYDKVYAEDPLEEGEVDTDRGREYRKCARDELRRLRGYQSYDG